MRILLISALIGTSLAVLVFACFKQYISPYDNIETCHKLNLQVLKEDIYTRIEGRYAIDPPFGGKDRIEFKKAGNRGIYTYHKHLYDSIFEIVESDSFEIKILSTFLQINSNFLYLNGNFYLCNEVIKDVNTDFRFIRQ